MAHREDIVLESIRQTLERLWWSTMMRKCLELGLGARKRLW